MDMKLGMVGLDTSHCNAFTNLLNNKGKNRVKGAQIHWAFPGGTNACSVSCDRVNKFTDQMKNKHKIQILDSIEAVGEHADAILLESCDGRQHLEQFKQLAAYRKPVFIDKPFTCSYQDALKIVEIAQDEHVPIFSASSLRYYKGIREYVSKKDQVQSLHAYGPVNILDDYPGYFWYGPHLAAITYAIYGSGCQKLQVIESTDKLDSIIATWKNGKTAYLTGYREIGDHNWWLTLMMPKTIIHTKAESKPPGYMFLLQEIMKFFQTKQSPILTEEMLEIVAFLEAINESRKSRKIVEIQSIMKD